MYIIHTLQLNTVLYLIPRFTSWKRIHPLVEKFIFNVGTTFQLSRDCTEGKSKIFKWPN